MGCAAGTVSAAVWSPKTGMATLTAACEVPATKSPCPMAVTALSAAPDSRYARTVSHDKRIAILKISQLARGR